MSVRRLFRLWPLPMLVAAVAVIAGCTVLESKLDSDDPGLVYYLPKTMMRVEITIPTRQADAENPVPAELKVSTFQVPDLKHRYTHYYKRNPFFHDRLCYTLDAANP